MSKNQWTIILAFAAVYIIWGSTYIAIMIGIQHIPPFILSAIRFLVAGIIMWAWCLVKKEEKPSAVSIRTNSIAGVLTLFGGTASVAWAEQYISTSLAAIIVTGVPFWFILLDKKQWSFYFSSKEIISGLIIGFAGVIILAGFGRSQEAHAANGMQLAGVLSVVAGGIAWTIGSLYSKYKPVSKSLIVNTTIQLSAAGIFSLLVSLVSGEWNKFSFGSVPGSAWLAVAYLVTMGSLVGYSCYLFLLKMRTPAQVSTYVYVNPVVALLLGTVFINEPITWVKVIALAIILSGVLLVNMAKYKTAKEPG
jgi:drug/metabolite transporter (DMT)-like permease